MLYFVFVYVCMAHRNINEYDAKSLRYTYNGHRYSWHRILAIDDFDNVPNDEAYRRVIKADMMFGQRWKHWLIQVNCTKKEAIDRYKKHIVQEYTIGTISWYITHFLIEPYIDHDIELYCAIQSYSSTHDEILLHMQWWIDIENHWNDMIHIKIPIDTNHTKESLVRYIQEGTRNYADFHTHTLFADICIYVARMYVFFVAYNLVYCESNPCIVDKSKDMIIPLDMVVSLDTCAMWKHRNYWSNMVLYPSFGKQVFAIEETINEIDMRTWASCKLTMLNPDWLIWFVSPWWGASVICMDTLYDRWLGQYIANYWELSWNPDLDTNIAYFSAIFDAIWQQDQIGQYICFFGAVANFTRIDVQCHGLVLVLKKYIDIVQRKGIRILVRRAWIWEKQWFALLRDFCEKHSIYCVIYDANASMVEILDLISLATTRW